MCYKVDVDIFTSSKFMEISKISQHLSFATRSGKIIFFGEFLRIFCLQCFETIFYIKFL